MHGDENMGEGRARAMDRASGEAPARTLIAFTGQQLNAGIAATYDAVRDAEPRSLTLLGMRDAAVTASNAGRSTDAGDVRGALRGPDGCETVPGELPARQAEAMTECDDNGRGYCATCPTRHPMPSYFAPIPEPRVIEMRAFGVPAPKGSKRVFQKPGMKRGRIIEDRPDKLISWETSVREVARAAVGAVEAPPFVDVPIAVTVAFYMPRGKGHWGTGKHAGKLKPNAPTWCAKAPDTDKLLRCTLDVLTGIVFDDDSRIVQIHATKHYASPGDEGAHITIAEAT